MNCIRCGSPLAENDQFCKNCGGIVNPQPTTTSEQPAVGMMNPNGLGAQPEVSAPAPTVNSFNVQPEVGMPTPTPNNFNAQPEVSMPTPNSFNAQPMNATEPNYSNNMNNVQPEWNNAPVGQPQPAPKSSGNGKYFAIAAIVIALIAAIAVVAIMVLGKDDKGGNNPTGGGTGTTEPAKSNYKVTFKGFTFEIPDDLIYEEKNGNLTIGDEQGTWATVIELEEGSFAQLKANKSQLQNVMQQSGFTSSIASEKTVGGVEFITLELSRGGQNAIAALTKANAMYFIGVTAYNRENEFDYKLLETVAPIIKSAKYTGSTTNNITGESKIDMSAVAGLAK